MTPIVARRVRLEDELDLERASQAGRLLAEALARLPPAAPEAVEAAAAREADDFLWKLGALYGVRRWDWAEFRRAYARGALLGWRPGAEVCEDDLALRVRCDRPLAPDGMQGPDGCRAFLAFQAAVVRLATDGTAGAPGMAQSGHGAVPSVPEADVVLDVAAAAAGEGLRFTPASMAAQAGQAVKVVFRNLGRLPHTFTLPDLGADTGTVPPGGERAITFRAGQAGTFDYFCTVPGHQGAGMAGRLDVT